MKTSEMSLLGRKKPEKDSPFYAGLEFRHFFENFVFFEIFEIFEIFDDVDDVDDVDDDVDDDDCL